MTPSNGNIFRVTGPLCGEFTSYRWIPLTKPVTRSFDVFLDLRLNKLLSKQSWDWWLETPSCPLFFTTKWWYKPYIYQHFLGFISHVCRILWIWFLQWYLYHDTTCIFSITIEMPVIWGAHYDVTNLPRLSTVMRCAATETLTCFNGNLIRNIFQEICMFEIS